MSNHVFVIDTNKQPLAPCTPGMARSLLKAGKALPYLDNILSREGETYLER